MVYRIRQWLCVNPILVERLCLLGIMKVDVDFMRVYVSFWVTGGDVCATLEQHTINDAIPSNPIQSSMGEGTYFTE